MRVTQICNTHHTFARKTAPCPTIAGGRTRAHEWRGPCAPCAVSELNDDEHTYVRYMLRSRAARLNVVASVIEVDAACMLVALAASVLTLGGATPAMGLEAALVAALLPAGTPSPERSASL